MHCQPAKITRHVQCAPNQKEMLACRFQHIQVDLVGPLPLSKGCSNIFTVVNRSTRWFEAFPLAATSAKDCAEALFSGWIARFGVPENITSIVALSLFLRCGGRFADC